MPQTIPQVRRLMFNDEEIGMGFNSESGLAVGSALEDFTVQADPAATGQEVIASITIVNSHEELMKNMGMSFELQGRYGFYAGAAKAEFADSTNYNSTSTFLVARCVVRNPLKRGKNFKVTAPAQNLLDSLRFSEFKKAFGDSFVRGLETGGEFYSVIRITSVSSAKQVELATTLQAEANGLVAGGEFSAKFAQANESTSTRSELTATMYQKAGTGAQIAPTVQINDVIARFKSFPEIAKASPVAYETEVATYDTLPLQVPTPEEEDNFIFALRDAREKKLRYIETRNSLEFALKNPVFFESLPSSEVLLNAISAYTKLINAVMEHAIKLSRGQIAPPRVFDPSEISPPIAEPAPIPLQRVEGAGADPIVQLLDWIKNNDSVAEPFFGEPLTGDIEQQDHGPVGGRFVLFRSTLDGNMSAGIFWHPRLGAHYVHSPILDFYNARGHCFGQWGYPVGNPEKAFFKTVGTVLRFQRFQAGIISIDEDFGPPQPFEP